MTVEFHYGALSDSLEEQAKRQGLVLDRAKDFDDMKNNIFGLWLNNICTDAEHDRMLQRLHKKVMKSIKKSEVSE